MPRIERTITGPANANAAYHAGRAADGYVWEMPGMRVFAIVGVQAFTVEDRP